MRFASISFALLLTPMVALAQNSGWQFPAPQLNKPTHKLGQSSGTNLSPVMAARLSNLTGACPVGLRAQRQGSTSLVVVDGKTQRPIGPTVRLTVNNLQSKNIVGATLRLSGYGKGPQLFLVQGVSSRGEMTSTVSVKLDVVQGKSGQTDLTAEKFGAVSRIYLEMVEYADGTAWRAHQEQPCSVEPDLLMLVADK
jgi:hypothetical protein